ncbi:MAG: DUF4358 domain-containing protein [Stomatobaculum sp.]|nr:DUF4358 domain-containing protein [Stomatobaculum sp.]
MKCLQRIFLLFSAFSLLCFLSCCSGEKQDTKPAELKTPKELYEQIRKEAELPEMVLGDEEYIQNYYGIDPEILEDYVFASADSAVLADAVIILKAKEKDSVEQLTETLQNIKEWKEAEMEDYAPEAYKVAKAASVRTEGNYVWLVMSDQAEKIEGIIRAGTGAGK